MQCDDSMADSPEPDSAAPDSPHAAPEAEACPVISRRGRQLKQVQIFLVLYIFLQAGGHVHVKIRPQIRTIINRKGRIRPTMLG